MIYEELLKEADREQLITKEKDLPISKGRIKDNKIAIKRDMATTEKACILAEELGHYHTTVGNILNQKQTSNRKQEYQARLWAYNRLIGLQGIISAYKNECLNGYEIAEYLEVTEEFFYDALLCYKNKYGTCAIIDNYVIYFEPYLRVFELL